MLAVLLAFAASLCAAAQEASPQETTGFKFPIDVNEAYTGIAADDEEEKKKEPVPAWFWASIPILAVGIAWVVAMNVRLHKYSEEELEEMKLEKLRAKAAQREARKKGKKNKKK